MSLRHVFFLNMLCALCFLASCTSNPQIRYCYVNLVQEDGGYFYERDGSYFYERDGGYFYERDGGYFYERDGGYFYERDGVYFYERDGRSLALVCRAGVRCIRPDPDNEGELKSYCLAEP